MERGTLLRGWTLTQPWQAPALALCGWRDMTQDSGSPWGPAEVQAGKAGSV